eukprot:366236-Chlamydomonas_euryale.AAC.7
MSPSHTWRSAGKVWSYGGVEVSLSGSTRSQSPAAPCRHYTPGGLQGSCGVELWMCGGEPQW